MRHTEPQSFLSETARRAAQRSWSWVPLFVGAAVLAFDQISKSLAIHYLSDSPHHLLGPLGFGLTYNTGSAFSLFSGSSILLSVIDVTLLIVLVVVGCRSKQRIIQIGLGLMIGGAVGNLCDRLVRHHGRGVVDFITLSHWPTFNLADSAIDLGVIVVIIGLLFQQRSSQRESSNV